MASRSEELISRCRSRAEIASCLRFAPRGRLACLLCRRRQQPRHSHQVVRRCCEVGQLSLAFSFESGPPETANGFEPAEDFFDAFAHPLAREVPGVTYGAVVDGGAP